MRVILGSGSLGRRKCFRQLFPDLFVDEETNFITPDLDEKTIHHEDPREMVMLIAAAKCDKVIENLNQHEESPPTPSSDHVVKKVKKENDVIVITADMVVLCQDQVRDKPVDAAEAKRFLQSYLVEGLPAVCVNGIAVHSVSTGKRSVRIHEAQVTFYSGLEDDEALIQGLVDDDLVYTLAGGFNLDILEKRIKDIKGGVDGIFGLPSILIRQMLDSVYPARNWKLPPLKYIKFIIFDLDGLLIDTESLYTEVQKKILKPFGIEFTEEAKCQMMGRKPLAGAEALLHFLGIEDKISPQEFIQQRNNLMEQLYSSCSLLPGVEMLLKHLHRCHVPMAVATGSERKHFLLKTKKYRELFDKVLSHVVTSDNVKHAKPNPELYNLAASKFANYNPLKNRENVLVFEDSPLGVEAALKAEFNVILLETEYNKNARNMSICRYWQQGACRFGEQCRFEHTSVDAPKQDITNTLVQTVKQDMDQWEKSHQWLFSAYTPAKECASIPGIGLDDISPEELRFEAYIAKQTNSGAAFHQKMVQLVKTYADIRRFLCTPNEAMKDLLRKIYHKEKLDPALYSNSYFPPSQFSLNSSSSFPFQSQTLPFGSPQQNPFHSNSPNSMEGIFVSKPQPTSSNVFSNTIPSKMEDNSTTFPPLTPQIESKPDKPALSDNLFQSRETLSETVSKTGLFGKTLKETIDNSRYTLSEKQLSHDEMEIFKSQNYILGKIPECPPPQHLC